MLGSALTRIFCCIKHLYTDNEPIPANAAGEGYSSSLDISWVYRDESPEWAETNVRRNLKGCRSVLLLEMSRIHEKNTHLHVVCRRQETWSSDPFHLLPVPKQLPSNGVDSASQRGNGERAHRLLEEMMVLPYTSTMHLTSPIV